jgi:hypothetical protein
MQQKPHAQDAKGAKAKSDAGVGIPDFPSPFREWIGQGKIHFLCALCVRQPFLNSMDSAKSHPGLLTEPNFDWRKVRRIASVAP